MLSSLRPFELDRQPSEDGKLDPSSISLYSMFARARDRAAESVLALPIPTGGKEREEELEKKSRRNGTQTFAFRIARLEGQKKITSLCTILLGLQSLYFPGREGEKKPLHYNVRYRCIKLPSESWE